MQGHLTVTDIAVLAHELNRTYCVTIGDPVPNAWIAISDERRELILHGVKFRLENLGADFAANHDNWHAKMLADGWVYGEVRDDEAKTHPNLVPYEKLDPKQRMKDHLFAHVVEACRPFLITAEQLDEAAETTTEAEGASGARAID